MKCREDPLLIDRLQIGRERGVRPIDPMDLPARWTEVADRFGHEGSLAARPDAGDRGIGCLGVTFSSFAEQEAKVKEYRRRIQNCNPVGSFVNDQVATVNFLYCHEDNETGAKTGMKMIGRFNYMAAQLDMAKEAYPAKSYPSLFRQRSL